MKKKFFKISQGFTLPELLVATALFLTVITTSSTFFLFALRNQKQLIAFLNAAENLSYAMEVMARDIRMGQQFVTDPEGKILSLINYKNQPVIYRLNNNIIERSISGGNFEPLTAPEIKISHLKFLFQPATPENQARITIALQIETHLKFFKKEPIYLNLQTTLSPRIINL